MQHDLSHYPTATHLMTAVRDQMLGNLVVWIDDQFYDAEGSLAGKELAKRGKEKDRARKDLGATLEKMYPLQVRMVQLETNFSFLLENAHNRVSYPAIARYMAEYDFLAKRITKLAKGAPKVTLGDIDHVMGGFLNRSPVLEINFFDAMSGIAENMFDRIAVRMTTCPEQYIDLNLAEDAKIDAQLMAEAFKARTKELKKEFASH